MNDDPYSKAGEISLIEITRRITANQLRIPMSSYIVNELKINHEYIAKYPESLKTARVVVEPSINDANDWYVGVVTHSDKDFRGPVFACGWFHTKEEADTIAKTILDLCHLSATSGGV